MLLAPFALTEPSAASRRKPARREPIPQSQIVPLWLIAWAVLGTIGVVLVPALRGGAFGGWTLPFWLAAAPCINIAWLTRDRWLPRLRRILLQQNTTSASTSRKRR